MSLFENQVKSYSNKFAQFYTRLGKKDVLALYKKCGLADVEVELTNNTKAFKEATLKIAMTLMPGIPSCTVYAAIVASALSALDMPFIAKAGTCIKRSMKSYEKDTKYFHEQKAAGIEHPLMATHVYIESQGKIYEYYSGEFSDIDHLDCVEIARS